MMRLVRSLYRRMDDHELTGRAAQMAFYCLIAIFPLLLAAIGVLGALDLTAEVATLDYFMQRGLPRGVAKLVLGEVHQLQARTGWPLLFTLVLSAYYGGSATASALQGVAVAFEIRRKVLFTQLIGLGFAGVFALLLPVLLILLTAASWFLLWASSSGYLPEWVAPLVELLRWPLMCLLFQQLINTLYRLGGAPKLRWGWFSWGSAFSTAAWVVITLGFEVYVQTVANLGATYGSIGTVVGLLLYTHVVSVCMLLGAELEAERFEPTQSAKAGIAGKGAAG